MRGILFLKTEFIEQLHKDGSDLHQLMFWTTICSLWWFITVYVWVSCLYNENDAKKEFWVPGKESNL